MNTRETIDKAVRGLRPMTEALAVTRTERVVEDVLAIQTVVMWSKTSHDALAALVNALDRRCNAAIALAKARAEAVLTSLDRGN